VSRVRVHVRSHDGVVRFDRLWDDGGPVLPFDSGFGFVARDYAEKGGTIEPGWFSTTEPDND